MKKIYSLIIVMMLLTSGVNAVNRFSVATGNWNSITTWSATSGGAPGVSAPVAGDVVVIEGGFIVTVNVASACISLTVNSGTLNVSAANLTIGSPGDVTVNSGGTIIFSSTHTITGGNGGPNGALININSGATLTTANASGFVAGGGSGSINVNAGSRGGPNYSTTANYTYNGGAQATGDGITGANNLTIAGSGLKTRSVAITVTGIFSIQGTATFSASPTYGAAAILEYTGSGAQTSTDIEFPAAGGPANLKINNAAGVTLHAARTITGSLTLTSGILNTTTNLLTINGTSVGGGGSASSHVNGSLAKTGINNFSFPVGNGTIYRPIDISSLSGSLTFTASYTQANPRTAFGTTLGTGVNHIGICEYWVLNRTEASGTATVKLNFGGSCNGNPYVDDPPSLLVARWTGASGSPVNTWVNAGNTASSSTSVTSSPVTSFSPFTIGSSSSLNPLPVKLSNIKAYEKLTGVQIDWTAYSEENLNKYQIERSADGSVFTAIGDVTARNSMIATSYGFFDPNPLRGVNFYRLKSIDIDGKSAYSSIVKINLDKSVEGIILYPSPVTRGYISLQSADLAKGNYGVKMFTATGQQVYSQRFTHTGGSFNQTIHLPIGTRPGMYSIQLDNDDQKVMSKTFMVQ